MRCGAFYPYFMVEWRLEIYEKDETYQPGKYLGQEVL